MNVLDLFSGIGGFSLGLERAGMTTVAFCEVDPWCRRVLAKHWPAVPCFDDVRTLDAETLADAGSIRRNAGWPQQPLQGIGAYSETRQLRDDGGAPANDFAIDLICGGYPCQPFSQAGQRRGEEDDRHLWPEMHRLVASVRPRWVIAENVAGHISMGLDDVLFDLEGEGYTCQTFVVGAVAVGAPHRRQRIWVVANAHSERQQEQRRTKPTRAADEGAECGRRWLPEPGVGRVANGIPKRVDRLKGLGNAVVPQIPEMIGRAIMAADT